VGISKESYIVGQILEERARSRSDADPTITYGELVGLVGLPKLTGNWSDHPLSVILGNLNDKDCAANRPFRSVLVVNARSRISGNLFFGAVEQLRYGGVKIPDDKRTMYWYLERDLLIRYWRKQ
jgi:hypothetical protein